MQKKRDKDLLIGDSFQKFIRSAKIYIIFIMLQETGIYSVINVFSLMFKITLSVQFNS